MLFHQKELSDIYVYRANNRLYATTSSTGKADYARPQSSQPQHDGESVKDSEEGEEEVVIASERPSTSQKVPCRKRKGSRKKEKGTKVRNEYLQWLQGGKEEKEKEDEKKMEKLESFHREKMQVLGGMLEVPRGLK